MNKQKITVLIGVIVAATLTGFFLTKTPVNKDAKQPCATSTSTDCLMLTPIGTTYYVPPAEKIPAPTPTQAGQIDEHLFIDNTLREVNFCGRLYKVKQVIIDGVDVVQRVAEMATKNLMPETFKVGPYGPKMDEWKTISNKNGEFAKTICENVSSNNSYRLSVANPTTIYEIHGVNVFTNTYPNKDVGQKEQKTYHVSFNGFDVTVDTSTNEIFTSDGYDGSAIGPLGKLK